MTTFNSLSRMPKRIFLTKREIRKIPFSQLIEKMGDSIVFFSVPDWQELLNQEEIEKPLITFLNSQPFLGVTPTGRIALSKKQNGSDPNWGKLLTISLIKCNEGILASCQVNKELNMTEEYTMLKCLKFLIKKMKIGTTRPTGFKPGLESGGIPYFVCGYNCGRITLPNNSNRVEEVKDIRCKAGGQLRLLGKDGTKYRGIYYDGKIIWRD